jgi:antitoxin FitA
MISIYSRCFLMAQFTVRNLEDDVKDKLKRRAAHHGFSMEEEVRQILRNAVNTERPDIPRLGSRIAARFSKVGLTEELSELRGQTVQPARF